MKTIVEALQDLYVALGGKKADVSGLKLNPDVIEQIAALVNEGALNELPAVTEADAGDVLTVDNSGKWGAAAPSGGSDLPEVTSDDNGDVLTVVEGAWAKATPGGGGAPCVSPVFTITGTEGAYQISCNKTYTELKAAYLNGLLIPGFVKWGSTVNLPVEISLYDEWTEGDDSGTYFYFVAYGPRYSINPTIPGNRLMDEIYIYYGEENGIPTLELTRFSTYNIAITANNG